jgi:hypothetical protein
MSGVDLDRLAAGCSSMSWRAWDAFPGVVVGVRAMSSDAWAEAMRVAADRVPSSLSGPARKTAVGHERAIESVVRSTFVRDESGGVVPMLTDEVAREMSADALLSLHAMVCNEQDESHGRDVSYDDLVRAIDSDIRSTFERAKAIHATGLSAYYGAAARTLTDWQVSIYLHLIRRDDE